MRRMPARPQFRPGSAAAGPSKEERSALLNVMLPLPEQARASQIAQGVHANGKNGVYSRALTLGLSWPSAGRWDVCDSVLSDRIGSVFAFF
jgi:hypothetical protein